MVKFYVMPPLSSLFTRKFYSVRIFVPQLTQIVRPHFFSSFLLDRKVSFRPSEDRPFPSKSCPEPPPPIFHVLFFLSVSTLFAFLGVLLHCTLFFFKILPTLFDPPILTICTCRSLFPFFPYPRSYFTKNPLLCIVHVLAYADR